MENKPCIMAVDDDEKILRVIEALLIPHGYRVILTHNGQEALTLMGNIMPDIVLLDIFMPKMDGYTTLGEMKKNAATKDVPVVMVTAVGQELNKKLASTLGAAEYITKPFKSAELLEVINRLLPASYPVA